MAEFYTLLTTIGEAKVANAIALGQAIEITHLAVGDGGGTLPEPQGDEQQLINEVRRAPINTTNIDQDNPNWIVVEQIIPPQVGGWTIREIGIYDVDGDLIAYGNYPPTFKPTLDQGSSRTQTVRFVLEVSNAAVVELKVDPSVVLATREYVEEQREEHEDDTEAHLASAIVLDEPIAHTPESESVQAALAALGAFAADGYQNMTVFDVPGVTEWTVPDVLRKGLRNAFVLVLGSGGGGGGSTATSSGNLSMGGGGAAGGWSVGLLDLSDVFSITVTIAEGGAAGVGGTSNPGDGSTSSFGTYLSATGGTGGRSVGAGTSATFAGSGNTPGVGIGGDMRGDGSPGQLGARLTGNDGYAGHGGSSLLGGAGAGRQSLGDGSDGVLGGGGGGGLSFNGAAAQHGGSGGDGIIIVRW